MDSNYINSLNKDQFAVVFNEIVGRIKEDPIENFVKGGGFIDFDPSAAQEVILKVIFQKVLDGDKKRHIQVEGLDDNGDFCINDAEMTEVEIYEFLTDKKYDAEVVESININKIDLLCGRRCLAAGTDVMTPAGPKRIEDIKVGDDVYGYTKEGNVELTKVLRTFDNGERRVRSITSSNKLLVEATDDHVFQTKYKRRAKDAYVYTYKQSKVSDIKRDECIQREFVKIPCGTESIYGAYSLGALLGDGCSRDGSRHALHISSRDKQIPSAIAKELNATEYRKLHPNNYTWRVASSKFPDYYDEWCKGRYAHDKIVDLDVINKWDRETCLKFMAGLLDSDGTVHVQGTNAVMGFGCQSRSMVDAFEYLFYKLWNHRQKIRVDNRKKYKNGPVYYVSLKSNLYFKRALRELDKYLKVRSKKWKPEYESLNERNYTDDKIGVRKGATRIANTYDLHVGNDSNLYILANEGLITHNSGKTTLSAIIAIYNAISTNWKPFLSKTPFATVLIMSHSREFSDEVLDIIKQFINESPVLTRLINSTRKQTASAMNLSMPFIVNKKVVNSRVQIKVGAASSKTTRGVAACSVIMDEICYWNLDENLKESDYKILKAVRPALKQFGKHGTLIKLSSPGLKLGVLYEEYVKDRDGALPQSYAVFKAPSWAMNTFLPKEEFVEEWILDPDGFDVEYRANFADSMSNFISPDSVELAVQNGITIIPPSDSKDIKYFAAIDAAYKGDRFTFSLVGITDNRVTQFLSKGWEGTKKDPVKANDVARWIKNATKDFPIDYVAADQFSFQPLKEIFDNYGLNLEEYTFTQTFKKKIYFNLKSLVHRQQIDLLDNPIQTKELKELVVEQTATGTVKIGHPAGGTDDFADSLAISSLLATEGQTTGKFEFDTATSLKTYGIRTDINGVALTAPSADMLVASGHLPAEVIDNSGQYGVDPEDDVYKHYSKFIGASEEDGMSFCFG